MALCFFDDHRRQHFFPLALSRPVADIRFGVRNVAETWSDILNQTFCFHSSQELMSCFPSPKNEVQLCINGRLVPDRALVNAFSQMQPGDVVFNGDNLVAACILPNDLPKLLQQGTPHPEMNVIEMEDEFVLLNDITDVFALNDKAIELDFELLSRGKVSAAVDPTCMIIGDPEKVFIEEGASVEGCFLNTKGGPIYIGSNATIMEASVIHGPFGLGDNATIKAGAKIYGATTIGPWCKIGGEVSNSLFQAYSNKGHDGFVGNSLVGAWCNFGADTNTSNLKNNYGPVKIWDYAQDEYRNTGLTFCGLLMGDHSKCSINTMFNTGTTVGVSCNIFGSAFPPKFVPSWSWGGAEGLATYDFDKSILTAERMMLRRKEELSDQDIALLRHIYDNTSKYRS